MLSAAEDHVADHSLAAGRYLLGETRDAHAGPNPDFAAVRYKIFADHLQERGFPFAIASEQTDALAPAQLQVDVVQQGFQAEAERDFVESNDGHLVSVCDVRLRSRTGISVTTALCTNAQPHLAQPLNLWGPKTA